jgi:hypothetical protein
MVVSEVFTDSIIRAMKDGDEGSKHRCDVR